MDMGANGARTRSSRSAGKRVGGMMKQGRRWCRFPNLALLHQRRRLSTRQFDRVKGPVEARFSMAPMQVPGGRLESIQGQGPARGRDVRAGRPEGP